MPDFFETLRINSQKISAYPIHEQWLDIGSPADFIQANKILEHDL
jgi:NDP-sugar pyrophosphorylase family protein